MEPTNTTRLEDLYHITEDSYTTGSEWLDGLIIGLASLLLIRNGEFVVLDILTFFYGNRKHRTGFRVLRLWQMLNAKSFYHLITGFDSDIPLSWLRRSDNEKRASVRKLSRWKIKKGRFASLLFISVLLGKLLVLGTEVAIIAFVIPVSTIHKNDGGLGIRLKNATITEESLSGMPVCLPMLTSDRIFDSAQLALCQRIELDSDFEPRPQNWTPNGSLRMEEMLLTRDNVKQVGGEIVGPSSVLCRVKNEGVGDSSDSQNMKSAFFQNHVIDGEIQIQGESAMSADGRFFFGSAAVIPLFSDAQKTLRLSFPNFYPERPSKWRIGSRAPAINGKLLFGEEIRLPELEKVNQYLYQICPGALDEIIRVTGTLHHGLISDLFRLSMTIQTRENFTAPSASFSDMNTAQGYQIGTSRKFRIQPEWMILAATLMIILSALTSHLNKTELRVARVYREHNNMWSAASPAFLDEENVVEGALFRKNNEYHWGERPGEEWEELSQTEFSTNAVLI